VYFYYFCTTKQARVVDFYTPDSKTMLKYLLLGCFRVWTICSHGN